jgi:hypothetical protein
MGLLKSVDNVPGINYYDYRDSKYYDKYEYRLRTTIPCLKYVWYCKKPEDIDRKLEGRFGNYGNVRKDDKQEVIDNLSALKTVVNWQNDKKKKQIGIRSEADTIAVFANDLSILKDFETEIGSQYNFDYTQAQTSQYAGVKYFVKEPKHKYRVYLRGKRVDENVHTELDDLFKRLKSLYPSPALKSWIKAKSHKYGPWYVRWTSAMHFIDYDDESTLSYLALTYGELLGKKYKLEKRPDTI